MRTQFGKLRSENKKKFWYYRQRQLFKNNTPGPPPGIGAGGIAEL